jgi:hypothetical protein
VQHGNLSNVVVPRLVVVYEGALGFLPEDRVDRYNALGSAGRWYDAARLWDFDDLMMRKIIDVTYARASYQVELVTYAGPDEFAAEVYERCGEEGLPVSRVTSSTAEVMARRLAYAQDIACVYDANRETAYMYGQKGRLLTSVHQLGR